LHIFEMPLLGYGGYLPFAMELHALYHLVAGLLGYKTGDYVQLSTRPAGVNTFQMEPERVRDSGI
jgi:hypothetical protein